MIHVGTAEDVLGCMADGWQLRGLPAAGWKKMTYWLLPSSTIYQEKRVSVAIVTKLVETGEIHGERDEQGEMRYWLVAEPEAVQDRLLEVGA